jgi:hypothetical protein
MFIRITKVKTSNIMNIGEDLEKLKLLNITYRKYNHLAAVENRFSVVQKVKYRIVILLS